MTQVKNFNFFQLISSNLISNYKELDKNQPELFYGSEGQWKFKHIKPHEKEEEFWGDLKISNMLGGRNDVESLRAVLRN